MTKKGLKTKNLEEIFESLNELYKKMGMLPLVTHINAAKRQHIVIKLRNIIKRKELIIAVIIIAIIDQLYTNVSMFITFSSNKNLSTYYLSLFFSIGLILFIKHRYWLISCICLAVNDILMIFLQKSSSISNLPESYMKYKLIVIIGIFSLVISAIYVYKFIKLDNYAKYYIIKPRSNSFS